MKAFRLTHHRHSGFSLIEAIMCITILGIMAAIAMTFFSNTDGVQLAKDQRNAQSLCSLASAAEAAGVDLIHAGVDKLDVLRALKSGVTVGEGSFRGHIFRLPSVDEADLSAAGHYLEMRDDQLVYQPRGAP